jgi:hypothetical protein
MTGEDYFDQTPWQLSDDERAHQQRWACLSGLEEGTPNEKRRHHFVPRMWLRNWADPDTGQIEVFDARRGHSFNPGTGQVMLEADLYRAGFQLANGRDMGPEEVFSRIEAAATGALRSVLDDLELDDAGRYDLSLLIALQFVRVPGQMRRAIPTDPGGVREATTARARYFLERPDQPAPNEMGASARGRSTHEIAEVLLAGVEELVGFERGMMLRDLLTSIHDGATRIYRRHWTVIRTDSVLLFSDNPVPLPPLGGTTLRHRGEVTTWDTPVPLDPHTVLAIGNRSRGSGDAPEELARHYAAVSNEVQIARSERFLVSPVRTGSAGPLYLI